MRRTFASNKIVSIVTVTTKQLHGGTVNYYPVRTRTTVALATAIQTYMYAMRYNRRNSYTLLYSGRLKFATGTTRCNNFPRNVNPAGQIVVRVTVGTTVSKEVKQS